MPGKPDAGTGTLPPLPNQRYFPGSKEYRAWNDGWIARYALLTNAANPFNSTGQPAEWFAWEAGYLMANVNGSGVRKMPATTGAPGALP